MEIYNYTVYHNFTSEPKRVSFNELELDIIPEFRDIETALEESHGLSYSLFAAGRPAGRLLFPWNKRWEYQGNYFDETAFAEIGRHIYFWIGLWE